MTDKLASAEREELAVLDEGIETGDVAGVLDAFETETGEVAWLLDAFE